MSKFNSYYKDYDYKDRDDDYKDHDDDYDDRVTSNASYNSSVVKDIDNTVTNITSKTNNSVTTTTITTNNSLTNNTDIDNITHITNNHYTVHKSNNITNYFYGTKRNEKFKGTHYKDKIFGNGGKDMYKLSNDGIVDHIHIKRDGVADVARKLSNEDRIDLGGEITLKTTQKGIKVFSNGVLELIYKGNNLTENALQTMIV